MVFWIRKSVPEPEEWTNEKKRNVKGPSVSDLFKGEVLRTTILTIIVCATSLTAWWGFMFWNSQHVRNLPSLASATPKFREDMVTLAFSLVIGISIIGNFF